MSDLRYSARSLTRAPGLALTLLLTIALGIGGNASVVGFVRGLVTRDLPLPGVEKVVSLFARDAQDAFGPVSYDAYLSLKTGLDVFDSLGAVRESRGSVVLGGRSSVMAVAAATPEFADLFQLPLGEGAVISRRVWHSEFGSKPGVQRPGDPHRRRARPRGRRRARVARRPVSRQRRGPLGAAARGIPSGDRSHQPHLLGARAPAPGLVGQSGAVRRERDPERRRRDCRAAATPG